jgi:DeoR family galactitol utilization operon repressor
MEQSEREQKILEGLLQKDSITVAELGRFLAVSDVTIRSDLSAMEERGLLVRVHGGAVVGKHPAILERQNLRIQQKQNIARTAAGLVQAGDTVMVEAGTTPALVCRFLAGKRDIHLITNSALAFQAAKNNPALKITLLGGEFRAPTESFIGAVAIETIRRFNVRYAFIGTDGFSAKKGITTNLLEGGEVIRVMKERAERTVVLSDSTKYKKAGTVGIMGLAEAGMLITDNEISANAAAEMGGAEGMENITQENLEGVIIFNFNPVNTGGR